MGKRWLAVLVIGCSLLLSGCLGDPISDDILNYVNEELSTAHELEKKAVSTYESVSGVNYTDDQSMHDALVNEVIPTYTEFIDELEEAAIETEELQEVHDLYLEGADLQLQGFKKIVEALEAQDPNMIDEANKLLTDGKNNIDEYVLQLNELAKEHNVEIEKN